MPVILKTITVYNIHGSKIGVKSLCGWAAGSDFTRLLAQIYYVDHKYRPMNICLFGEQFISKNFKHY